jgi:hypothetical protein
MYKGQYIGENCINSWNLLLVDNEAATVLNAEVDFDTMVFELIGKPLIETNKSSMF